MASATGLSRGLLPEPPSVALDEEVTTARSGFGSFFCGFFAAFFEPAPPLVELLDVVEVVSELGTAGATLDPDAGELLPDCGTFGRYSLPAGLARAEGARATKVAAAASNAVTVLRAVIRIRRGAKILPCPPD